MSYPNYPELKDSGVEWLGEIPAHWDAIKLKYIGSIKYGLGQPPSALDDGLPLLRATNVERGRINSNGLMFIDPNDVPYERDPILRTNDIIVVRSGAYTGDSAIVPKEYDGAIAGYDMVVRVSKANSHFVSYGLLSAPILNNQIDLLRMRAAQPHLNAEELGECLFFIPKEEEQQAIAAFLDRKMAELDELIRLKERQIELLGAKRQALISHAVTRGLDPSVKLRPSGIEWLGEIPAHWEIKRLKYITPRINVGLVINPSTYTTDTGVPFLFGADVVEGEIKLDKARRISEENSLSLPQSRLETNDLVTVRVGYPGVTAVVPPEIEGANCASMMVIKAGNFESQWLCSAMNSVVGKYQVERVEYGAAQKQFNISDAVNFTFPVPPKAEQRAIVSHLDQESVRTKAIVEAVRKQIEKLKEYRQALISAAVTGKIDVRGVSV